MLRSAAVTADLRYQLTLHADSLEQLLRDSEAMDGVLADAAAGGILEGWQSVTRILPSERTQEARRARIPARADLASNITAAVDGTPFRADAFDAFLDAADAARTAPALTASAIEDSPLSSWLDAHRPNQAATPGASCATGTSSRVASCASGRRSSTSPPR